MPLTDILLDRNKTELISITGEQQDVVIGAPHHTPAGIGWLPAGRVGDENTGFLALRLAEKLNASLIVAVNAEVDPNKSPETDYFSRIKEWDPGLLVEIHGHGGSNANYDIEISAGSPERSIYSRKLADYLKENFLTAENLAGSGAEQSRTCRPYTISGSWDEIYLRAGKTKTINTDRWLGIHIELPFALRLVRGRKLPPESGYKFCDILAEGLKEILLKSI